MFFAIACAIDIKVLRTLETFFRSAKHGEGQALALREGDCFFSVARGAVPRERWAPFCRSRSPDLDPFGIRRSRTTVFYRILARDRPSPYVKGTVFLP